MPVRAYERSAVTPAMQLSFPLPADEHPFLSSSNSYRTTDETSLSPSRTDHLQIVYRSFPVHGLGFSRQIDIFPILYDLAHVSGWEPYSLHDLGHVSRVGSVLLYVDPAQLLTTADEKLDDICR